jgi:hypothetical protein
MQSKLAPLARFALSAAVALSVSSSFAQSDSRVQVSGFIGGASQSGGFLEGNFNCTGTPTCIGRYNITLHDADCSNGIDLAEAITITGLELSRPGTIRGEARFRNLDFHDNVGPGGTCVPRPGTFTDKVFPYEGSWDGSNGTFVINGSDEGGVYQILGVFKADVTAPPPVFPMVVTGSIDANVGNIQAEITFRPQDIGSSPNIYVFAVAPAPLVKSGLEKAMHYGWMAKGGPKDTPVQCVLAQLSSSGQLVGVSASTMQAYISGVLSSQGAVVKILDGVPTVKIGGATFYVGYGSSATAMINGGVNRSAVTAPGAVQCKPQPPQTGWWWNPAEDGRGFSIEVRGNHYFFAGFLYDVSGRSTWYVGTGDGVSLDGSLINGDLLSAKGGQALAAPYNGGPTLKNEGPITLAFSDVDRGTLVWPGGVVPIQRFSIVPNGLTLPPVPNQPESGWWWNESESGRGFFMEWQAGVLDIAGYMYDAAGDPVWYLTGFDPASAANPRSFQNNWWSYGNGQTLTGAWKPNRQLSNNVAPVTIQFSGPDTAVMSLPNGRTTNLKMHRF